MLPNMDDPVRDLLQYIDRSPSPYHAVAETAERLRAAGFEARSEREVWDLAPGARCFATRAGGSLIAFQLGSTSPAEGGFRILGAHTDSPNLRLKPRADVRFTQLPLRQFGSGATDC